MMERRILGRTGLKLAVLGFGCGNVGGLMVRGTAAEQDRAVTRAIELGINYFDTAPSYGDGASEANLGRVLRRTHPEIIIGTKLLIKPEDKKRINVAIASSLEGSLRRLGRETVDILYLHNAIGATGVDALPPDFLLYEVVPAVENLRRQGKIRFSGITAIGDTEALHRIVTASAFDAAQIVYNLLNPSAGVNIPPAFAAQNFSGLLQSARAADMGAVGITVLACGALTGTDARHPLASKPDPMASGPDYSTDLFRARRLQPLVSEGHTGTLLEAALRFSISNSAMTTVLVGYSSLDQLEAAAAAIAKGPLPTGTLNRLRILWQDLA
jgi:aryl-alcohol dehydrogenase-like predicted oxidoreductase